ncbi:hypothetical protein KUCAC02_037392 [Chaenocephalus aceratus]|nr:hypothetical protein KUCAC02_037392 [Chaenocephalus aceratus]
MFSLTNQALSVSRCILRSKRGDPRRTFNGARVVATTSTARSVSLVCSLHQTLRGLVVSKLRADSSRTLAAAAATGSMCARRGLCGGEIQPTHRTWSRRQVEFTKADIYVRFSG